MSISEIIDNRATCRVVLREILVITIRMMTSRTNEQICYRRPRVTGINYQRCNKAIAHQLVQLTIQAISSNRINNIRPCISCRPVVFTLFFCSATNMQLLNIKQ